ncbi:PRD domain-containing protein [Enterococcus durans]|uniref:PRD domain-containing protein n=2 Tax=Enterococcus durans TaxID=53345 RepID=UPI0018832A7C|nr:PRD domain-containing protein [Enterococcus durans]MBE9887024.1 PRD domain-containing protein [Enterococcus durans]MDB1653376.1 PRD domain-containing protein [Enterococcus durans]MDB1654591.1 PRD domain-containing protein [Enterococcus durans]MDB1663542.1 PRD domain-containing protein [Enterococcus durans]MDB1669771.1 PRD domain-containing protein [Enterococcus durans]
MKIKKFLNNNVVLLKKGSNEIIGFSTGISFKKKTGDDVEESDFEKIFVLDTHAMLEHFSYQLSKCDPQYVKLVTQIVEYAKQNYHLRVNDYIYLTLLDHIDFTVRRLKENMVFKSPLQYEVRRFYPDEYAIGVYAVQLLERELDLEIPTEEAISIALHFVNIQSTKRDMTVTNKITKFIEDVLTIVRYEYTQSFDENSFHFSRFVTHLHYFAQNVINHTMPSYEQTDLFEQVEKMYPKAFHCVGKIKIYIKNTYNITISENEEIYLTLHIQKLTEQIEKR